MKTRLDVILVNRGFAKSRENAKAMIMSGELAEGEALPSMRNLALQMRISVITTKRAYEELERDGFIESYTGKGSFVKGQNADLLREMHLKQVEEYLSKAVETAKLSGMDVKELGEILELLWQEGNE